MRGITKRYPGVTANDHIDLDLQRGEIHALLGENGAGKTTLMNILYGLAVPDEGQILVDGAPVRFAGPSDAIARGIEMVHQHFMLIPVMSVAENVILAEESTYAGIVLDFRAAARRVRELSERFSLAVNPQARIENTTVAQQQRDAILESIFRNAMSLNHDEPTSRLPPPATSEGF